MNSILAAIYADGGCVGSNPSLHGGVWAWCGVTAEGQMVVSDSGLILPGDVGMPAITNNLSEYVALVRALEYLPDGWSGRVCSDSSVSLGRLFRGWKHTGIPPEWIGRARRAKQRLGDLTEVLHDGHPTKAQLASGIGKRGHPVSSFNVFCDRECNRVARKQLEVMVETVA